ncbi:MAG TPA: serine/threonine-protein kinase [Gemmatimonadaceae bacterium]|jgi:serine/threonine-protein kinase|nr:serine/threonine-protein kinase [Gemmatimonadaceae bacterium]
MTPVNRGVVTPRATKVLPPHLVEWQLPPEWSWGPGGMVGDYRHYQEVIDVLGRSLSLVTAPDPAHTGWLFEEARQLAQRSHPSIPTTYHYWTSYREGRRGPGYLRRWVTGETVRARLARLGLADIPYVLQLLRGACSTLAYLHETGIAHGGLNGDALWTTPTGRLWMLEWQWAVPRESIPAGVRPGNGPLEIRSRESSRPMREELLPMPPEWESDEWIPTPASDQWQLAAMCFTALTGEAPPSRGAPPVKLVRPETPESMAIALDRALSLDPGDRYPSLAVLLRAVDRGDPARTVVMVRGEPDRSANESAEARVRWAVGDDYEILSKLGSGAFGTVWRARDLSLEREVALKALHPSIARDDRAVRAFWREAKLAAQLAHPAIVPIYDWDSSGDLSWYTMELAEEGSVASLIARSGPRQIAEIASQVDQVLDGLIVAHANGILHRDLKPENVLIDRYQRWRITDFGIANVTGEDVASTTGTPAFAAPEQLLGELQGPAADYFALASIVYFTLTGDTPFGADDARSILARQLGERADLGMFPSVLASWFRTAFAAKAEDRFADGSAMKLAWEATADRILARQRGSWWRRVVSRPDLRS